MERIEALVNWAEALINEARRTSLKTIEDTVGKTVLRTTTIGGDPVFIFTDNTWVGLHYNREYDEWAIDETDIETPDRLRRLGLITNEEYSVLMKQYEQEQEDKWKAARRQQYEKLKKEFESEE